LLKELLPAMAARVTDLSKQCEYYYHEYERLSKQKIVV
jgi:hypothetical protein